MNCGAARPRKANKERVFQPAPGKGLAGLGNPRRGPYRLLVDILDRIGGFEY